MPGLAKVIVVEADPAASAALRFGLSRAGLDVEIATPGTIAAAAAKAGVVLLSERAVGSSGLISAVRAELDDAGLATPLLFVGNVQDLPAAYTAHGEARSEDHDDALAAGATEALCGPLLLRDIANVVRIMLCERRSEGWAGTLLEISGVFGLVRALAAIARSGVLTLTRGVRRGEIRYYHGEITSAQVGMIHGQAAFHQLLLWTDAKFDFRHEEVVRRRQIPLSPEELIADAEQFLEATRDLAGGLSPSVVLDVASDRIAALAIKIPTEVHGILNMFDGRRSLVDILEDSPYRVHETLRVARKGFETKVLRAVPSSKPRPTWRAVLSLEEWLLGAQPMVPRQPRLGMAGISPSDTVKVAVPPPISALAGSVASSGLQALSSGTVEAAQNGHSGGSDFDPTIKTAGPPGGVVAVGGHSGPARRDPGPLEWADLVPRTTGLEMPMLSPVVPVAKAHGEFRAHEGRAEGEIAGARTVIVSEDAIISPEERAEEERLVEARKQAELAAIAKEIADAKAATEAAAKEAAEKEAAAKEAAEKEAAAKEAAAKEAAAKEAAAKEAAAKEAAAKEAAAKEAAAKEAAAKEAAAKEAAAKEAAAKEAAVQEAAREAAAKEAAVQEAAREAAAKEVAAQELAAKEAAIKEAAAAKEAAAKEAAEQAAAAAAAKEAAAKELAAREAARAKQLAEEEERLENEKTTKVRRQTTADVLPPKSKKRDRKKDRKSQPAAANPAPSPAANPTPSSAAAPAKLTADSSAAAIEVVSDAVPEAVGPTDSNREAEAAPSAPTAGTSEASKAQTGPVRSPRAASSPSILVDPNDAALTSDLQAAHSAASALAKGQAAAASSSDASAAHARVVEQVRNDASKATAAFTADEEAFFQAGGHGHGKDATVDSFADLDVGYRRPTFWQRLLGRKPGS